MPARDFPKDQRIRKRVEYQRVFRRGRRIITPGLIFFVSPNSASRARLGMAVSKKTGNAVKRNHIKRLIREAFRHLRERLPSIDLVAIPRRGAQRQSYQAYVASFELLIEIMNGNRGRCGPVRGIHEQ